MPRSWFGAAVWVPLPTGPARQSGPRCPHGAGRRLPDNRTSGGAKLTDCDWRYIQIEWVSQFQVPWVEVCDLAQGVPVQNDQPPDAEISLARQIDHFAIRDEAVWVRVTDEKRGHIFEYTFGL